MRVDSHDFRAIFPSNEIDPERTPVVSTRCAIYTALFSISNEQMSQFGITNVAVTK